VALLGNMLPLSEYVLMVSGRGGFEIVQKALAAGPPIVASVSAPSGLVQLAREPGLTLVGFLRGRRVCGLCRGAKMHMACELNDHARQYRTRNSSHRSCR
jgi:formate dehydrogenase accessory protein FdhD